MHAPYIKLAVCVELLSLYRGFHLLFLSLPILTAVFPGERGLAGFTAVKNDGGGGDNRG